MNYQDVKPIQPGFKNLLLKKIVEGQTEEAIKALISEVQDESTALFQELIQLEIQTIRLEKEVIKGILSRVQENLERNRISDRLLHLINHVEFKHRESKKVNFD